MSERARLPATSLAALRRFARGEAAASGAVLAAPRAAPSAGSGDPDAAERCDLCGLEIAASHEHLFDPQIRSLRCACSACALLFSGQGGARWRRVAPARAELLEGFRMTDAAWAALGVPIGVAFFSRSSADDRVIARFPSPAGVAEAPIERAAWAALAAENPVLAQLEPDIEALLVHRLGGARELYRASIDVCFRLAGLLRAHWRGLSGGADAWAQVDRFFAELRPGEASGHA